MANYEDPNKRQPRGTTRDVTKETKVFEVDVVGETEKAWKVRFVRSGEGYQYWFPKSQCELYERNLSQYISIPMWLVEEKGIEDEAE